MMRIVLLDGYNGNVKVETDVVGTIVPNNNRWGLTNGWKLILIDMAKHYRIRKLTPTECLRLMGVSDSNIAKMKGAGISDSQLYKMAGNSIVVQVLEGIFRQMHFAENPLRVFEAFAGYGSQSMALENIGVPHEVVGISEIDKYAIMAYNATHPDTKNYGDICDIDWSQVPDFDFFTYSFPCGLAGTLVKMQVGYKRIEDVKVGDYVLTHNNRYCEVVRTMSRISESFYEIKAIGCHLFLTKNHPLWVLRNGVEQWVKVGDLKKTDRISYCIPQKDVDVHLSDETLWMLGRYVADGWVNPRLYNSVEFAIGIDKEDEFIRHIPDGWQMRKFKKSCWEYRIADAAFQELCLAFGNGSRNKKLPEWIINLPKDRLAIFLDGYFAGDGHIRYRSGTKVQMFSTVSKELFCGIQMCLLKLYGKVCSLTIRTDKRKDSFNDSYNGQIAFSDSPFHTIIGSRCFVPIRSIVEVNEPAQVYNLEVLGDNSYTCDNVNTHNCTDISNAGAQAGFDEGSGTRSSLLWECKKAIEEKRPKYLLMENVKAITSKKFLPGLLKWQEFLSQQGYVNFIEVLNAKDYGVPQNRERCFLVSFFEAGWYQFPEPIPLETKLADILEEKVDEKYYLDQERVDKFIAGLSDEKRAQLEEGRTV